MPKFSAASSCFSSLVLPMSLVTVPSLCYPLIVIAVSDIPVEVLSRTVGLHEPLGYIIGHVPILIDGPGLELYEHLVRLRVVGNPLEIGGNHSTPCHDGPLSWILCRRLIREQ